MLRHKNIERICCVVLALTLVLTCVYMGAVATGAIAVDRTIGYENRLFNQGYVHTIEIVMDDWDAFLDTCTSEIYSPCTIVIDGEAYGSVGIRGKGNTSLSSVQQYGNDRYSFKVEFDQYQTGASYHGLDKLSLNNLIQDNTYLKDYTAYTLMNKMGVAAPLCSFVRINVNGEYWGLYLAVEGVEDSFLQRNYGADHGELYKPDSMSFGGGRGNGRDFDMNEMMEQFDFGGDTEEAAEGNEAQNETQAPFGTFDTSDMGSSGGSSGGQSSTAQEPAAEGSAMPDASQMPAGFDMSQMPQDMQMPEGFDMSQIPEGAPAVGEESERGGPGDFGGFGGFGMGSSDVKLQYIDDNPSSYSNIFNNAKTDINSTDAARLIASLKSLSEGDLSVVDEEAVIAYMAVHNFLCNEDSYTGTMVHNYYLYEEDGVMAMIPWDYNLAFGSFNGSTNATSTVNTSIDTLVTGGSSGDRPMASWITQNEDALARYHEVYAEFMETVFNNGWFETEMQRVIDMIAPYVESDPTAFCTYEEFEKASQILLSFCTKRAESVNGQLEGNAVRVDASDVNISAMGSMGGGGGGMPGGFDRDSFDREAGRPGEQQEAAPAQDSAPAADAVPASNMTPATVPENMPADDASFGGSHGEAAVSEVPQQAATENVNSSGMPAANAQDDASSGGNAQGQAPTNAQNQIPVNAQGQAPANMQEQVPVNVQEQIPASTQQPEETPAASAAPEAETRRDGERNSFPDAAQGGFTRNMSQSGNTSQRAILLGACVLILAAAMILIKCFKVYR